MSERPILDYTNFVMGWISKNMIVSDHGKSFFFKKNFHCITLQKDDKGSNKQKQNKHKKKLSSNAQQYQP